MPSVTLADLAKLKAGSDGVLHLVDAVGLAAPEVLALPSRIIKGTSYDVTVVTGYPTTAFRKANQGVSASGATFETRKSECFILDTRIEVDKAVARAHDAGPDALMALYSMFGMKSALLSMGRQTIYGQVTDASGFYGLKELSVAGLTVDATGSTADTASSVYFVCGGPMGVEYIYGEDTTFDLQPFVDGEGVDANSKKFPAHVSYLNCRPGLSCASPNAVGRIKNLTAQSGKGMTDALAAQLLALIPLDTYPTHVFMNRRSRYQLQVSRTVVLQGNGNKGSIGSQTGNMAPIPTEVHGIPIVCTDSILNTDAID